MDQTLTQDFLKSVLDYDPETGIFTWKARSADSKPKWWNSRYAGKQAGTEVECPKRNSVYVAISILGRKFYAHRLAVLYMTGKWPSADVDHKDTVGTNNRWENLREATKTQNGQNRGVTKRSTSGLKGAHRAENGMWQSTISINGKVKNLGRFPTKEEAHAAYAAAAAEHHGEFARSS